MIDLGYDLTADRPPQIGLIVLQADETIETDFRRLIGPDAEILVSRVASAPAVSMDSLAAMASLLTGAAALFPEQAQFGVVGYGCTSATARIGAAQVKALVQAGVPTPAFTEPLSALIAALHHIRARRLAILTPYEPSVTATLCTAIDAAGIDVTGQASFNETQEHRVVRIAPHSIAAAAVRLVQSTPCDAVFLSCTNLRTLSVIDEIEARIDRPVLSSNLVLAWHMMRLAGLTPSTAWPGRLAAMG